MTEHLRPCPWCGSTDRLRVSSIGSLTGDMPARPHQVRCGHLDCEEVAGPVAYGRAAALIIAEIERLDRATPENEGASER